MIIGIGTDLADSRRVAMVLLHHGENAGRKLMTPGELLFYKQRPNFALEFTKVFAAKEAVVKAIGTIVTFSWHDIEICHYANGCPFIAMHEGAQASLTVKANSLLPRGELFDIDKIRTHISFADEPPYVSAMCVIEYALW
jgi:holo-[acyl-carrier protein] synthase